MTKTLRRRLRERACLGKRPYYAWDIAWIAAKQTMKRFQTSNMRPYNCPFCNGIHVGHVPTRPHPSRSPPNDPPRVRPAINLARTVDTTAPTSYIHPVATTPTPQTESSMIETITIAGNQYQVPSPFTEGHTCTAGEASALNQLLHENVRNNLSGRAKKSGNLSQDEVDTYVNGYNFGIRTAGAPRVSRDPVEARAMKIAKAKVEAGLKSQGKNPKDYKATALVEAATRALAKHPEWRELAARQIADEAAIGMDTEVELDETQVAEVQAQGDGEAQPKRGRRNRQAPAKQAA